jgi:predicted O-methyltransferase YrrM
MKIGNKLHQTGQFIKYLITARSYRKIHPPFAFEVITTLKQKKHHQTFDVIKNIYKSYRKKKGKVEHTDLGANAKNLPYVRKYRRIRDIAKKTSIKPKYGRAMFYLINQYKPKTILELGTSLGISTLYLSQGNRNAKVISIEGCAEITAIAAKTFKKARAQNIDIYTGGFESLLKKALDDLGQADLVFFDGNHRKKPTLDYFQTALPYAGENSIFIFDDIHWSPEMTRAWKTIGSHQDVTLTLDLFQIGLVFFKKGLSKQNLVVRY